MFIEILIQCYVTNGDNQWIPGPTMTNARYRARGIADDQVQLSEVFLTQIKFYDISNERCIKPRF
jgi:hypothetical protein